MSTVYTCLPYELFFWLSTVYKRVYKFVYKRPFVLSNCRQIILGGPLRKRSDGNFISVKILKNLAMEDEHIEGNVVADDRQPSMYHFIDIIRTIAPFPTDRLWKWTS